MGKLKIALAFMLISTTGLSQIRELSPKIDTLILTRYLENLHKHAKNYHIDAVNVTMNKYLKLFNKALDYSQTYNPLSDQNSINIFLTPNTTRNSYLNTLNFGTRKDGSNNLSGTRFNRAYSEYSKRYDYLYRKE